MHLRAFVIEYKHCQVQQDYRSPDGFKLGLWVTDRRTRKHILSLEQIEALDALGFDWDPLVTQWQDGFQHLQTYVEKYGTCPPQTYKSPDGYRLGRWVSLQRLNRDDRSRKQIEMLDALGFDWVPFRTKWDKAFAFLEIYREHKGHCLVPADYKTPDGYYLGKWVRVQRRAKLSDERKARLDALGFDWEPE